ncbi:MAG: hypothetical protein ACK4SR_06375 [Thiobacillus sp.]
MRATYDGVDAGRAACLVGLMHEWVLTAGSHDLAACTGPLPDTDLACFSRRPLRRPQPP